MESLPIKYHYFLGVAETPNGYLAFLESPSSPLSGTGATPLEAIRSLCETLQEWSSGGGAERWLESPDGAKMKKELL